MMNRFIKYFLIIILALMPVMGVAQVNDLPRSTPEREGVKSSTISKMLDVLSGIPNTEIHHVMVVRHGKVIAEYHPAPYKPEYRHTLYSCSKTFVSMAVGIAIGENKLKLTDRVASFFPEQLPDTISQNLSEMTVRNLLTMTSGIVPDWNMRNYESNWIKSYLAKPVICKPGSDYKYDSMCTFMLSAILQRVTGMKMLDYLKIKFFTPMNITDVGWEESPDGINTGGWGLHLQSESLAKLGILILNKGEWNGKQLVPKRWIEDASSKQVDNTYGVKNAKITDSNQGYGYQMWCCKYPGAIRADGAYGQFVVMVPDKDIVVVINGNCIGNSDDELNAVWDVLMPGVDEKQYQAGGKEYKLLLKQCANARLETPKGKKSTSLSKSILGKTITLQKNKHNISNLSITQNGDIYALTVEQNDGENYVIPFDYKKWSYAISSVNPPYSVSAMARFKGITDPYIVAGAYAWSSDSTLLLTAHYPNWISSRTFLLNFQKEEVKIQISENFSLDPPEQIIGALAK
ncbi:MAG: serine hydrolase [Muribaculaceae bacterium]